MEFTTKDFIKYLLSGLPELFAALNPVVIKIIAGILVVFAIKRIARKIVYWHSILSGCSKKETKKRMKTVDNAIDLISAVNDVKEK